MAARGVVFAVACLCGALLLLTPVQVAAGTEVYEADMRIASPDAPTATPSQPLSAPGFYSLFGPVRSIDGAVVVDLPYASSADSDETGSGFDRLSQACAPLQAVNASTPWVALLRRGGCYFTTKVDYAFSAGAVGAIIVDSEAA